MASNPNEVLTKNQARKGAEELKEKEGKEGPAGEQKGAPSRFKTTLKGLIAGLAVVGAITGTAVSGCSEDNQNPPMWQDGGPDASLDADTDSDADTSTDTGTDSDTTTDTGTDSDTTTDTGTDSDTTTDSGTDTDLDAGSDGGADSGPALCEEGLVAEPEEFTGIVSSGTPQEVGGYAFEYLGLNGLTARYRISCGGVEAVPSLNCPLGSPTPYTTAEGRIVTITPGPSGPSTSNVTISVE